MDHYLNDGKINFHKKETIDLIKRKHEKMKNKNGSLKDEDKNEARIYVEMFYENIIPAVTEQDNDSILMVLKTFHFSEADEHRYHIISCFEATLAIYFLNPGEIVSLWEKSNGHKINSFFAMVPVSTWPKDHRIDRRPCFFHLGFVITGFAVSLSSLVLLRPPARYPWAMLK